VIRLPSQHNIRGFSLIQVSVLLMVGAIVLTSLLPASGVGDYSQKVISNTAKLDAIETATIAFMSKYGRRPCPASGQYNPAQASFGLEQGPQGSCVNGALTGLLTVDSSGFVVGGTVPTKTLNLTDDYAFDAWGRQFTYLVDMRATLPTTCYALQNIGATGGILVPNKDGSGTIVSTDHVMVAYTSHGPNGHGAFPPGGSTVAGRVNLGITDPDTMTNADVNAAFTYVATNTRVKKDRTTTFDNLVYYRRDTMNSCCSGTACTGAVNSGYVAQGAATDAAGTSMAVGDVNGDGIDDLIIGAPGTGAGHVYVILGNNTIFSSTITLSTLNTNATTPSGLIFSGVNAGDLFGQSVAVGDVNGDGIKDIIIGAPGYSSGGGVGAVYVVFGRSTWSKSGASGVNWTLSAPDGASYFRIDANAADSAGGGIPHTGTSVAAGNIIGHTTNGTDSINAQDIIIGAPGATVNVSATNYPGAGKAYVLFGTYPGNAAPTWAGGTVALSTAANTNGTHGFEIDNNDSYGLTTGVPGQAGFSVAAGNITNDITNNSADDVIIGAPYAERANFKNSGKVYVVFGKTGAWTGAASPVLLAGLNGSAGTGGVNGTFGTVMIGDQTSEAGMSVAAGDINGDGIADLILGAPITFPAGRGNAGSIYVIFGQVNTATWNASYDLNSFPTMTASPATGFRLDGSAGETAGTAVASGCSVIGNGVPVLMIGAPNVGYGSVNCLPTQPFPTPTYSNAYVVYGSSSGAGYPQNGFENIENLCSLDANNGTTTYTNGFYTPGAAFGDQTGSALASLDINQAGKCTFSVGAPGSNTGGGYIYMVPGKSSFYPPNLAR